MDNNNTPITSLSTPIFNTNHYISSSSSSDPSDHQHQQQLQQFWLLNNSQFEVVSSNPSIYNHHSFNLNHRENDDEITTQKNEERRQGKENDDDDEEEDEKEAMFEKPLTPSDVGKLNRLVIPKQHAEKYFPLGGNDSAVDKGLLLSFEDESGKSWRFRYSYWNSSQSYVLTKGWSRYVKEKRLDAGDVVLFERHRTDADRLFIGWRRRAAPSQDSGGGVAAQVSGSVGRGFYNAPMGYPAHHLTGHYHNNNNNNNNIVSAAVVPYQPDCIHAGLVSGGHQNQTTTIGNNSNNNNSNSNNNNNNNSKIVRLFGVNLECHEHHDQSEPSTPDGSSLSTQDLQPHHHFYSPAYYADHHHHNHMDFTFSRDVKPMRDRRG